MLNPDSIFQKAKTSSVYLRLLNWLLTRMIPFNKSHDLKVQETTDSKISVRLPYKRRNLNHIKGIHACAMATLTEYTSGLFLISKLGMSKYRIILQKLDMEYHYQGKMDAVATFGLSDEWLKQHIIDPLADSDSVVIVCEVKILDVKGNHLSTGRASWQLKDWHKVKTRA